MKEIFIAVGQVLLAVLTLLLLIFGVVWLIDNSPANFVTLTEVEGFGTFACREKYQWLRKDYSKVCIKWPD